MKKITYIVIIMLMSTLAYGQSYKEFAKKFSYELSYEQAMKRAKEEKKDVLLIQVSNYCPWCRKLEKRTLSSDKINKLIQQKYIPLIVNRQEGTLHKRFATPVVPVSYIIDYRDDTKFKSFPGYQSKTDFYSIVSKD
ncbi:thioredoxin family protein [Sulfurimonas sp.]|uniref:thioredoxin family protein n=1 Tax=Sulfurimonas sp. TaxID=2022749 RepID=UPI0025E9D5DE|nr:thioredoxin family protein [Sulfurimonas sp.]MBT5935755.1 thioredoxin family protein [Sulfurimonas sp.]